MSVIYRVKIKKEYASAVIEDLQKMKAIELIKEDTEIVPEWQKTEVRKRTLETQKNPSSLVDESVIFNILNRD